LRKNATGVPKGRSTVAQDVSPGKSLEVRVVP
jgi:hypothetical protein